MLSTPFRRTATRQLSTLRTQTVQSLPPPSPSSLTASGSPIISSLNSSFPSRSSQLIRSSPSLSIPTIYTPSNLDLIRTRNLGPKIQTMTLITINHSIIEALKNNKIIPDVIDEFTPSVFLQVEFPSGKEVQLGNTLKKDDTQETPYITITPEKASFANEDATYTLCMTDPDAPKPSDPENSEFLHWLITDIKPSSGVLDLSKAKVLMKWMGPAPPEKTGKHRYVLLFFKNKTAKDLPEEPKDRKHWGLSGDGRRGARKYSKKYGMELIGANFFYCQNDNQ